MAKIILKTKKDAIPEATVRLVGSELRTLWESYQAGKIKHMHYTDACDKVYIKYKISKESFNDIINSWFGSGKTI